MSLFSKWFGSKDNEEQKEDIIEEKIDFKEDNFDDDEPLIFDDPVPTEVHFNESISVHKDEKKSSEPNNLLEAIHYVVVNRGGDYLHDRGFINILNDFQVFKDFPAAKHIILNMQTNGYIGQILQATNWEIESKAIAAKYSTEFGAKEDIVLYLVHCLGYGLGYSSEIPLYSENEEAPQPHFSDSHIDSTIKISPVLEDLEPYDPKRDLENYHYPTLDLLKKYDNDSKPYIDMVEQDANKNHIVEVLRALGVEISMIKAIVGSTITFYEITLATGIRISKVRSLEEDITLSLGSIGVRVLAPIPGKTTIGIEVPNAKPSVVLMESILNSKKFQETTMELPCAIGKTITNEVFMFDLAKAPHLLISGAIGQGKSVGLNVILTSLLYKKHPAEMKIVLVDPKMVEFGIYKNIAHHFLAALPENAYNPIITDSTKAIRTLNSLCVEMDARYEVLMAAGERNIKDYNRKFKERKLNPDKGHRYMPYIVLLIDEYSDLIMSNGKEVESKIAQLAQKGHIVGIHMIIATQRPTTKIITDTIKSNIPARIAFKVSLDVDSKTILDRMDATQLIGRGDMLYQTYGGEPVRVQCAFVDTPEVADINKFIGSQEGYGAPYELPNPDISVAESGYSDDIDMTHLDPLFEDAARLVVINQSGSTSLIQRKFAIGYNRAGRLMDQLEKAGVVGAAMGAAPRQVFIHDERSLNKLLSLLR